MDKKLLSSLNNLSFALETISEILSKKGDKKSDVAKALSSSDLSKKFDELNKSLKEGVEFFKSQNKKTTKDVGFNNITKKIDEISNSLKVLQSSNRQMITLQKSISESKPEFIVAESKIILPKLKPIEIQLRYGKLPPLALPIPKPIELKYLLPKLPTLTNIKPQEIPLIYGNVPSLPELAKVPNQEIQLTYGKLPTLPKIPQSVSQEIPLIYGNVPSLPELAKVPNQEIQLTYGKLPTLPKIPQSVSQEIPIFYGKLPTLPNLPKIQPQEIELKYSKVPPLPKLPQPKPIVQDVIVRKKETTIQKQGKQSEDGGLFGQAGDPKEKQKIAQGVKLIILIAAGVLAIGLAFKLVGGINIGSVLALGVAISILAVAFAKLAEAKNLTIARVGALTAVLIGISLAVMASSYILSMVRPVGIFQLFTSIMIAAMFTAISYGLSRLLMGISRISGKSLLMLPLLPFIMVGISLAITASSYILGKVQPIGIFQAFTAIMIAAVFSAVSYGLGNLLQGLSKLNIKSLALIPLLPLILIAISAAIVGSSYLLAKVQPIGIFQAFTAIFIGLVFAAVGYGLGKILQGMKEIKNPAQAALVAAVLPLVLIAVAAAITVSSWMFAKIKPVGIFQLFTAIFIGITFIPISYAIPRIANAIKDVKVSTMVAIPLILIAMAVVITLSSYIFAKIKPVGFAQLLSAIGISVALAAVGYTMGMTLDKLSKYKTKDMMDGAKHLLIIVGTLVISSILLAAGQYQKYPEFPWIFYTGLAVVGFGYAIYTLDKIKLTTSKVISGAKSILVIAGAIALTSLILSIGTYNKYPEFPWLFFTSLAVIAFGGAIYALDKLKIGIKEALKGAAAILIIASTVMLTSLILSVGNYSKYPGIDWTIGVAAAMIPFGIAAVLLGTIATSGAGALAILAGLVAIIAIAGTILAVDAIISSGSYTKPVPLQWTLMTAASMIPFGLAAVLLGPMLPLVILGGVALLAVAATVLATDKILSSGDYTKYPSFEWSKAVGLALGEFAIGMGAIGAVIVGSFGLGAAALAAGAAGVLGIAETVVQTSDILAKGNYKAGPTVAWASGVALSLSAFSDIYKMLVANSVMSLFGGGGIGPKEFSESVVTVANAVVTASNTLANGKFTTGPTVQWASGVAIALGAFSNVYKMLLANAIFDLFGGGGVGPKEFGDSIVTISDSINIAAEKLSKGKFTGGPTKDWAEGVGLAIGAFSSVYKMLLDNAGIEFFRSGVTPEQYSQSIITIAGGITEAARIFSTGAVAYVTGPTKQWAEGVSIALGGFAPIYGMLVNEKIMKAFTGSGVSAEDFSKAIVSISQGITTAAKELASNPVAYVAGPTKTWAEGVSLSLQAFSSVFKVLGDNSGWFSGPIKPETYRLAIQAVGMGLSEAAKAIGGADVTYDLNKVPSKQWGQAVSDTFQAFIPALKYISEQSGWFSDGAADTVENMKAIATSISDASVVLRNGDYTVIINKNWSKGLESTTGAFINIIKGLVEADFDNEDYLLPSKILNSIATTSVSVNKGNYSVIIPPDWINNLSKTINKYISLLSSLQSSDVLDDQSLFSKPTLIIRNIVSLSLAQSGGRFDMTIPQDWMSSIKGTILEYVNLVSKIKEFASDGLLDKPVVIAQNLVQLSSVISLGNFVVKLTPEWINNLQYSFKAYINILAQIKSNDFDEDDYGQAINIARTMSTISSILSSTTYKLIPIEWVNNVFYALKKFSIISKFVEDIDINDIVSTAKSIVDVSRIISLGRYNMIPKGYMENINSNVNVYLDTIKKISTKLPEDSDEAFEKILNLSTSIKNVSHIIAKGNFTKMIPKEWMNSIGSGLLQFSNILKSVGSEGFFESLFSSSTEKIESLANGVIQIANIFNANKVPFDVKKVPSLAWSQGFSTAINAIVPGLNYISQNDGFITNGEDKFKSGVAAMADAIVSTSLKLAKGNFNKIINPQFFRNLADNTQSFLNIVKSLEASDADYDSVTDLADSMVELAKAYDRLGESLTKLNGNLAGLDLERITLLKNLAGSVVMLSLMDPTQFSSMLDELETRAGTLLEVISDTEESATSEKEKAKAKAEELAAQNSTTPTGGSTGPKVTTPEVKTKKPEVSTLETTLTTLNTTMGQMSADISSIAGVIAGRGANSLSTYISARMSQIKKDPLADLDGDGSPG